MKEYIKAWRYMNRQAMDGKTFKIRIISRLCVMAIVCLVAIMVISLGTICRFLHQSWLEIPLFVIFLAFMLWTVIEAVVAFCISVKETWADFKKSISK